MSRIRMLMTAALILIGSASAEPPKPDSSDLIGAWQLVSVETISPAARLPTRFTVGNRKDCSSMIHPAGCPSK